MRKKAGPCKHHKKKIKGPYNYLSLFSVHKKRHVQIFQKMSIPRPAEALGKRLIDYKSKVRSNQHARFALMKLSNEPNFPACIPSANNVWLFGYKRTRNVLTAVKMLIISSATDKSLKFSPRNSSW